MKIKKISSVCLFFLFVFVLSFGFVKANDGWYQNANSNYQSAGGSSFIMYGSNTANPNENITYQKCSFLYGSDYQPVADDFTRDGFIDVVLTDKDTDTIYFYGSNCELLNTYPVVDAFGNSEDITAMPIINFPYTDSTYPVLNILTNETIKDYMYWNSIEGFINLNVYGEGGIEYTGVRYTEYSWWDDGDPFAFFNCNDDYCLLFREGDKFIYQVDLNSHFITNTSETLTTMFYPLSNLYAYGFNGVSSILGLNNEDWAIACSRGNNTDGVTNMKIYCNLVDITTGELKKHIQTTGTATWKPSSSLYDRLNFGGAIQGGEKRIYLNYYLHYWYAENTNDVRGVSVIDLTGNILYTSEQVEDADTFDYSNIAVADFNKDGSNEMCYFNCSSTNSMKTFNCYDADYDLVFQKLNMSSDFSYSGSHQFICPDFVMGDLMPEYDNMCLASVEGIFCFNGTNDTIHVYDTGYTTGTGTPIIVEIDTNRSLGIVYADADKGFVITPDYINYSSCGDGICDAWENEFTCPEDFVVCLLGEGVDEAVGDYSEGSPCDQDSDCAGDMRCEYGFCTKLPASYDCSSDEDCISGDCMNGKCTKASWWIMLQASKDQQFGDDTNTNNFLALFFMLMIAGFLGYYGNVWMGVGAFYVLGIFFTIVGWLSMILLFGLILTGVIAIVFKFMIGKGE